MRHVQLLTAMLLPAGFAAGVALAQAPTVVNTPSTPAPVPNVMPGVPGAAGPGTPRQEIAPPAFSAGPADATPFSASPSAELPADSAIVLRRSGAGPAQGGQVPNLSK